MASATVRVSWSGYARRRRASDRRRRTWPAHAAHSSAATRRAVADQLSASRRLADAALLFAPALERARRPGRLVCADGDPLLPHRAPARTAAGEARARVLCDCCRCEECERKNGRCECDRGFHHSISPCKGSALRRIIGPRLDKDEFGGRRLQSLQTRGRPRRDIQPPLSSLTRRPPIRIARRPFPNCCHPPLAPAHIRQLRPPLQVV